MQHYRPVFRNKVYAFGAPNNQDIIDYRTNILNIISAVSTVNNITFPLIVPTPSNYADVEKRWGEVKSQIEKWSNVQLMLDKYPVFSVEMLANDQKYFDKIMANIGYVIDGDLSFIPSIARLLHDTQDDFTDIKQHIDDVITNLQSYSKIFDTSINNMTAITDELSTDISADQSEIQLLKKEIENLNNQLNGYYATIAGLSVGLLIEGAIAVVGFVAAGFGGFAILPFMVILAGVSIWKIIEAAQSIESTQKEIAEDKKSIASYTKAIASLTWVSTQLQTFKKAVESVPNQLGYVQAKWNDLTLNVADIQNQYQQSSSDFDAQDWQNLLQDVAKLKYFSNQLQQVFESLRIDQIEGRDILLTSDMDPDQMKDMVSSAPKMDLLKLMFPNAA